MTADFKYFISDYVGHMKLVDGQTLTYQTVLDEVDIAEKLSSLCSCSDT